MQAHPKKGVKALLSKIYWKIRRFLSRIRILKKIYTRIVYPNGAPKSIDPNIYEITPYTPRRLDELGDEVRLNLIIPTVDKSQVFGGISTAVSFFDSICAVMNVKKRIIVSDGMDMNAELNPPFSDYKIYSQKKSSVDDMQILPYFARIEKSFPVGKNDIFVATAWWTAYCVMPVLKWQSETYGIPMNKLIYLVQDYEPFFYQWSSRFALAESTYKTDYPVIAVYNTSILRDYFDHKGYKFHKEYYFEPSLNKKLKASLPQNTTLKKKKQILIYGRPGTPRNAFELICAALSEWAKKQPNAAEWTVLSAGESFADIQIAEGVKLQSVGKLSLEAYAKTMEETYLGISIMVSPHPSYPPLEMSTFGIKTITNCYANKDLSNFNENMVSLKNYSPSDIANKMLELCAEFKPEAKIGYNEQYLGGKETFKEVAEKIKKDLAEK